MSMNRERFVGIDLETSGLNHRTEYILEVGLVVTDAHLVPIHIQDWQLYYPHKLPGGIDPKVIEMHTKNGLWDECKHSQLTVTQVGAELERAIVEFGGQDAPLLTSNPRFERDWLEMRMPNVASLLHYRSLDVNTLYLLEASVLGLTEQEMKLQRPHRAVLDLLADIEKAKEWAGYLERLMGT